jgi:threonylcarbamoyladenosine tRNA methylthiotransferase MtaB
MKIVVYTLGCKVNQYESDSLSLALENNGHVVSNKLEHADIYIVNTCAVTSEAERKSRQVISKIKKLNPDAKICICGCASERDSSKFKDLENVRFISGVANKLKIVEKIEKYASSKRKSQKNCLIEIEKLPNEYNENYLSKPSKTRAFIKIQDGCNNFCTYCVIPYLRGRSRSRNVVEILNEIDQLQPTVKEIVLTGIDISDFKIDGEPALGKLLTMLKNNNVRVRLGSLEQGVISKEFLQSLEGIPNLCPHFHLSLQIGRAHV